MTQPADDPTPQPPDIGQCRAADLEIFAAGAGQLLVYARDSGAAGFYRAAIVDLLMSCRQFATIDQHVQAYTGNGRPAAGEAAGESVLRRELVRLRKAGFLVGASAPQLPTGQPVSLPPVSSIAIPTCDRVHLLRRAVTGYALHCSGHGREIEIVVADDSASASTRASCRSMLSERGRSLGVEISYAGQEEKSAFVSRLAEAGNIPEQVVRFSCLPDRRRGVTIGANRNAILLHTVGERILSADDDTVCAVAAPPGQQDGLDLDSGGNPLQLWFFGRRDEALGAVQYVAEDLLACHDRYLGAAPGALLAAAGDVPADRADPALLRRVRAGSGRITVTVNGTVGDCGWDNPDFHLFQEGATLARLIRSEREFDVARTTREMIQAVTRTTITGGGDPKFAMCFGLDNTALLPPFPPVGRAEEVAFGAILAACFGDSYVAHLPWLVQHDPDDPRQFSDRGVFAFSLGSWLRSRISRFDPGLGGSCAGRLRRLGQLLTDLGGLSGSEFDELVRLGAWSSMSALVRDLEDKISGSSQVPAYWARAAQRFIARARSSALHPVADLYPAAGGRRDFQALVTQFGQLLIWWPDIVQAARQLRRSGDRLARPVRDLPGAR